MTKLEWMIVASVGILTAILMTLLLVPNEIWASIGEPSTMVKTKNKSAVILDIAEERRLLATIDQLKSKSAAADPAELSRALLDLGRLYMQNEVLLAAEDYCRQACIVNEKAFGPMAVSTAEAMSQLALVYMSEGRFVRAGRVHDRLKASERFWTKEMFDSASDAKKRARAGENLLMVANLTYGENDYARWSAAYHTGTNYILDQQVDKGMSFLKESWNIAERRTYREWYRELVSSCETLARQYKQQHNQKEFEHFLQLPLKELQCQDAAGMRILCPFEYIAFELFEQERVKESKSVETLAKKTISECLSQSVEPEFSKLIPLYYLACLHYREGNLAQAKKEMLEGWNISERTRWAGRKPGAYMHDSRNKRAAQAVSEALGLQVKEL